MTIRLPKFPSLSPKPSAPADACLLIHDQLLIHLGTGQHTPLLSEDGRLPAEAVAEAAARLLAGIKPAPPVALCLPAAEFVATTVMLPGIGAANLRSAVQLQLPALLPGVSAPLLFAVQADSRDNSGRHVALWLAQARADALFEAFQAVGLELRHLLPRPLLALPAEAGRASWVHDEDEHNISYIAWSGQALQQWLSLPRDEWEDETFRAQLDAHLAEHAEDQEIHRLSAIDWESAGAPPALAYAYALTPPGALRLQAERSQRRKRRWLLGTASAAALLLVLTLGGFLGYRYYLERELADLKERNSDVTRLREEIMLAEERFGPIQNFPQQKIPEVLERLNALIPKDTWLTAVKVEDGVVELEGYGPNPAKLLELIANSGEFDAVAFSRSTESGRGPRGTDQFGIQFHLSGIDVHAYLREYFPLEN